MADFIGMTVALRLKQPSNTVLHGRVKEVVPGQQLTLEDVYSPATGSRWPLWAVQATAVADLQVIESTSTTPTPVSAIRTTAPQFPLRPEASSNAGSSSIGHVQPLNPASQLSQQLPTPSRGAEFVDPAILHYGAQPVHSKTSQALDVPQKPLEMPATPIRVVPQAPTQLPAVDETSSATNIASGVGQKKAEQMMQATVTDPLDLDPLDIQNITQPEAQDLAPGDAGRKKLRRGQKKKNPSPADLSASTNAPIPAVLNPEVSRNGADMNGSSTVRRGKGWRQDPLLQPSPQQTASPTQTPNTQTKPTRKQREAQRELKQNGWATEDVTDVQDDFDFEANHRLFDKKTLFEEMRQGDTTADEDRLVSHNRIHRPGTGGGKNFHPTESVLSPKVVALEVESTSDADTELDFAATNGRSESRHSVARGAVPIGLGVKKLPSRQNSMLEQASKSGPLSASLSSDRGRGSTMSRSATSRVTTILAGKPPPSNTTSSPHRVHRARTRTRSPQSAISNGKRATLSPAPMESYFRIRDTQQACPVLHPQALGVLEDATISQYGLSASAVTETAAKAIAELALSMFEYPGSRSLDSRRGSRTNGMRSSMTSSTLLAQSSTTPVVVILADDHASGARALAAARHLSSRDCQIIIAEVGPFFGEQQSAERGVQGAIIKRMQRAGADIKRGDWNKAYARIKTLSAPPAIIIDALLGGFTYTEVAATTQEADVRAMIDWANRSRAPVLSLNVPSGVSAIDGSVNVVEGEPVAIRPDRVLAFGAPLRGLLDAAQGGERFELSLADVGFNISLKKEERVAFGGQWVVQLELAELDDGYER